MFNCVPAEQTVAMRKAKFLKRVNNSNNMLFQTQDFIRSSVLLRLQKN